VGPEAGGGLAEVEVLLELSNGFVELWLKPVACGDDGFAFVWVSDLNASITDDAAPRASSIAELRKMPHRAAVASTPTDQQAPCHREKPNKIRVFCTPNGHPSPAIDAAAAEFSAHRRAPGAARSTWVRAPRGRARVVSGMQGTNSAAKTKRQIKIEGTVSGRKNQAEVSSSSIGAILAVSVGKMLSYIARAS
jgi:hypothetical protein